MPRVVQLAVAVTVGALVSCKNPAPEGIAASKDAPRLPTGTRLDPAGPRSDVGALPLAAVLSPDSAHILLLLNGWRQQGVQVVDRKTGTVIQTLDQPAAFIGLTFAPDGRTVYASGGNTDVVYRYDWASPTLTLRDSLIVRTRANPRSNGSSYPAGLGLSRDGRLLYVAENLADSLAVIDVATGTITQRLPAGRYPYGVIVNRDGTVYVSSWGTDKVHVFTPDADRLRARTPVTVARHPSTMLLSADGSRLFATSASTDAISVIDTRSNAIVSTLRDPTPADLGQGSAPIGLHLSRDGTQLFVTEGDNNAVAIFSLSARTAGIGSGTRDSLLGRAPVGWYPSALVQVGDTLHVIDAKGRGTAPNPKLPQPGRTGKPEDRANNYTSGQISGTITKLALSLFTQPSLSGLSGRVARANNWDAPATSGGMPPIRHVIYVIKENRTYDQVFADLPAGDGDTTLLFFPRNVSSPNHHALAERFGLFDRFFVNAEVSADGHGWSTAAYTTDYTQKTVPSNYSGRGRSYDYEGTNRGRVPMDDDEDDVAAPTNGYLWDLAQRKGITFRNYGEFVTPEGATGSAPEGYRGVKPFLRQNTSREFPGYNLDIPDQRRADVYLKELAGFVTKGEMPQLQIIRLPNDHTAGASANKPTPQAHFADNDLALGRIVDGISKTKFWQSTAIFVLEDDAQNGPDHVDSHRSLLLVISPWARSGAHHRFVNTTDVIATMESILDLKSLSPYDHYGRPLREIWRTEPDLRPYTALIPATPLSDRNPARGTGAIESRKLDLRYEDVAAEDAFNRILWYTIKGTKLPYPGPTRMSAAEVVRSW